MGSHHSKSEIRGFGPGLRQQRSHATLKTNSRIIYEDAQVMSLINFLANCHEVLRQYLGDVSFASMARDYIAAHLSETANARWYCQHLPAFLKLYKPFKRHPEIHELANLEAALNFAFDAPEAQSLSMADMAKLDPEIFTKVPLNMHPSAVRLTFSQNTTSIWSALKCEEHPPKPHSLDAPQQIAVWRQGTASRFRILGDEEAMAFDSTYTGANFTVICEMITMMEGADTAATRAASYLRGWVEAELVLAPLEVERDLQK
jgi:Putative DNA-binding domain